MNYSGAKGEKKTNNNRDLGSTFAYLCCLCIAFFPTVLSLPLVFTIMELFSCWLCSVNTAIPDMSLKMLRQEKLSRGIQMELAVQVPLSDFSYWSQIALT